ncbi:MAG: tRNA 2-thiouridine(34) synthase MnmA [Armatimonadetes bacterium]|nr:tRNA 2-thiouridine(34) synthase MnmA [Armatimonadota bacterium]
MKQRVLMAMSGGVDSSVAAALLVEQGYEVIGVTMKLWAGEDDPFAAHRFGGCCTVGSSEDARRVAHLLDIPYYVLNLQDEFHARVVDDFVAQYSDGKTPNPCARCNEFIKFRAFLERADELDCQFIATGHYARIERDADGTTHLRRGHDTRKDQSYVLGMLTQHELRRVLLPIGEMEKPLVRERAAKLGMAVATKPDSQEICFVEDDDYAKFVIDRAPQMALPGPIFDENGVKVGNHNGLARYTVGQRKGLGIASANPLFVTKIDGPNNTLIVGSREKLAHDGFGATRATWTQTIPRAGQKVAAQLRAHSVAHAAQIVAADANGFEIQFEAPSQGVTPGQMAVLYDGDEVVGAGTIE